MGISAGPNIVRDSSLVLELDAADLNSYNPAENLTKYSSLIGINSGDFGNGYIYANNVNVTLTASLAPDGTNTATLISQSDVNDYIYSQNYKLSPSTIYTYSIYIKQGTKSDFTFTIDENGFGGKRYQFQYTFSTKSIYSAYTGNTSNDGIILNSGSFDLENGWIRLYGTFLTSTTRVTTFIDMIARFGNGTGTTYVWGRQLEQKSSPTNYTPTTNNFITASTTWNDLSGNNIPVTLINPGTSSFLNNTINFTPSSSYNSTASFYSITDSRISSLTTELTLEAWLNPTITNNELTRPISPRINESGSPLGFSLGNNYISFEINTPDGWFIDRFYNNTNIAGKWIHIMQTTSNLNKSFKTYVNGILVGNVTFTGTPSSGGGLLIGRGFYAGIQNYTGFVGNVRMYNRVLSAQEILQNYNALKSRFGLI